MILAHKTRLYPNKSQDIHLRQACGCARFAYNWALNRAKGIQAEGGKFDATALRNEFNKIKKEQFPFVTEVSKLVTQIPIENNLKAGFTRFFKKQGSYPVFKKKGKHDACQYEFPKVEPGKSNKNKIFIPRLGWVKMAEEVRFKGRICSFTISKVADMWYISIIVDAEVQPKAYENQVVVGVDLGIKHAIVLSDGTKYDAPRPLKKGLNKLKLENRRLSRKTKGSNNHKKQAIIVGRLHHRIGNIRKDFWHKTTTKIANKYSTVCIEDLNVSGMLKNRCLSQSLSDVAFGSFAPLISYKLNMRGGQLIKNDRWFASTKTCYICGIKNNDITLADREWTCPNCGTKHDRDVNAAKNLVPQNLREFTPLEITPVSRQCAEEISLLTI